MKHIMPWASASADCNKAPFRQEAFFQYLVGVNEPDLLAVFFLDSEELLLFLPRSSPDALRYSSLLSAQLRQLMRGCANR